MYQYHDNEIERRKILLAALSAIFKCYLPSQLPLIAPSPVSGDWCSDGRAKGPAAEVLETVVEIKNELEAGDVDLEIQFTADYIQANYEELYRLHNGLFNTGKFLARGTGAENREMSRFRLSSFMRS